MNILPDANTAVIDKDGRFSDQIRLYLLQLGDFLTGRRKRRLAIYADLAALTAAIPNPDLGMEGGLVTGQGLAVWDGSDWVLASDFSTPIV